jgi:extracellular elastinolytic metalloproteinase
MRHVTRSIVVALGFNVMLSVATMAAIERPSRPGKPDLDIRYPTAQSKPGGFVMRPTTATQLAALELMRAAQPELAARWDGVSGSPKWLSAATGHALSAPFSGGPVDAARAFLESRSAVLGLLTREVRALRHTSTVPDPQGGFHVHFEQRHRSLDVFGAHVNVNLNPDGSVRSFGSTLFAGLDVRPSIAIEPAEAVRVAVRDVYPHSVFMGDETWSDDDAQRRTVFDGSGFGFAPQARLVIFPEAEGARLAWEVRVGEPTLYTSYVMLVDATDGSLLLRRNTTRYAEARYLDANRPDPPTEEFLPIQHVLATIPTSTPQSPSGWISGDGTILAGNNASSHLGHSTLDGLSDPAGSYDFPYNTARSALVNAWWWANRAHDLFYDLGFDEPAGNFQQDNFGLGGVGGDPLKVVMYTAGPRNTAFFAPSTVDGDTSTINFAWSTCRFCGDHDGYPGGAGLTVGERGSGFMRDMVIHEYGHGVSHRMVGGPGASGCLGGDQSSALGEAWSDVFAASLFDDETFIEHFYEGAGRDRDLRHDLTYDELCEIWDFGGGPCEEHVDGLIFGGTLWDLRQSMEALDPVNGVDDFNRIVLRGLASTPCNPTFIDARDGILDADSILFGSAHEEVIRNVFAARGMGRNASSSGHNDTSPTTDFSVAPRFQCSPPSQPTSLTATPEGDNAVRLDYTASGAAAVEVWRDDLSNPHDIATRIAFTDDPSTFLDDTVQGGKSYRYHVVALGAGGLPCAGPPSATADATATGVCQAHPIFDPDLTVADGAPDCQVTLNWSPATEGCPGSGDPIVYNVYRAPTPGFEPAERLLIGRTTSTTFQDIPPDTAGDPFYKQFASTQFYLVTAQHGTLAEESDHGRRGTSQIMRWAPSVPTLGRTVVESWDFDTGAQGWTADNTNDPTGGWVVVDPSPTYYAGELLNPDEAAGGSGMAWVTGDAGGPSGVTDNDCDATTFLTSPVWDGTGGATILSFDHWSHIDGNFWAGMEARVDNGATVAIIGLAGLLTVPTFETAGRHGWQRFELNVADYIAPTSTMSVTFVTFCGYPVGEFGIDNVRVEQATACSRSGLRLESIIVDDTPAGWGNGNGALDPGETVRLSLELANDGTAIAFTPVGTMSSSVPGLLIHEESDTFPDIAAAATAVSDGGGFTLTVPDDRACVESLVLAGSPADSWASANGSEGTPWERWTARTPPTPKTTARTTPAPSATSPRMGLPAATPMPTTSTSTSLRYSRHCSTCAATNARHSASTCGTTTALR